MTKNNLSIYELVLITTDDKEETRKKISQFIDQCRGEINNQEAWGRKTFSYPIKKNTSGFYFTYTFKLAKNHVKELKKRLDFDVDILRYLLANK